MTLKPYLLYTVAHEGYPAISINMYTLGIQILSNQKPNEFYRQMKAGHLCRAHSYKYSGIDEDLAACFKQNSQDYSLMYA